MEILHHLLRPIVLLRSEENTLAITNGKDIVRRVGDTDYLYQTVRGFRSTENITDPFTSNRNVTRKDVTQQHGVTRRLSVNETPSDNHITEEIYYLNFTNRNITVVNHYNLPKVIYPSATHDPKLMGKFILGVNFHLKGIVLSDNHRSDLYGTLLSRLKTSQTPIEQQTGVLLQYFIENIEKLNPVPKVDESVVLCAVLELDLRLLEHAEKETLFLAPQNTVVSLRPPEQVSGHPFSDGLAALNTHSREGVSFFIIDNHDTLRKHKYVRVLDRFVKVSIHKKQGLSCGLYFKDYASNKKDFIPINKLTDVDWLFDSKEEAEDYFNIEGRSDTMKSELELLKVQKLKELEEAAFKIKQLEQENISLKGEREKIAHKNDIRKITREERKAERVDTYDRQKFERESISEGMKMFVTAVTTAGIIFAGIKAFGGGK